MEQEAKSRVRSELESIAGPVSKLNVEPGSKLRAFTETEVEVQLQRYTLSQSFIIDRVAWTSLLASTSRGLLSIVVLNKMTTSRTSCLTYFSGFENRDLTLLVMKINDKVVSWSPF
ncbi:hypothetical protein EVAR_14116_1 [Eumeta japonica]|uniref:Uncharacterized protein n=1 Tax=Eumeta variegata TaxID=151549 RepID=A0A4C1UNC4_EUMVA|nr:hypothetical protein EVAR_14116_1 [Eumeta japonica]